MTYSFKKKSCTSTYGNPDSENAINLYGGASGSNSRCFASTVNNKILNAVNPNSLMCHETVCESNIVSIIIEDQIYPCIDGGVVNVNTSNFIGTINCPADMISFCNPNNYP